MATRILLLCGHRYGARLAAAALAATPEVELVHALVLHPRNTYRYGGYESAISALDSAGIGITHFDQVGEEVVAGTIGSKKPNYVIVCGLRQIIPIQLLWQLARDNHDPNIYSSRGGFVCFHPSDLPDGAGMAPVQWTVFEGASELAVSAFFIDDRMIDGGPIIHKQSIPLEADEDASSLDRKIGDAIATGFSAMMPMIAARNVQFMPQSALPVQRRERPQIPWKRRWMDFTEPVENLVLLVRAFTKPYGGVAALIDDRAMLVYRCSEADLDEHLGIGEVRKAGKALIVGCADGALRIDDYEKL